MRDILILVIFVGSIPLCLLFPAYGVYMWYWVAMLSPHRFAFGFAYSLPVAYMVAIPTILGTLFQPAKWNRGWLTRESAILLMLWGWFVLTSVNAINSPVFHSHALGTTQQLERVSKILVTTLLTIVVIKGRKQFQYLLWVVAGSLGLLAVKGSLFGLRTGGESRVWGPPDSFLADNNDFGLALNMCLPIFYFLAQSAETKLRKRLWYMAFIGGIFCVVLTYSRGALLGLGVTLALITLKSKHKAISAVFVVFCAFMVLTFAPDAWMDRMGNFAHGKLDTSAQERLISWSVAINLTKDYPLMGGGFDMFADPINYQRYQMEPLPLGHKSSGPHSIYFQVLGEQGYGGLALFLLLLASCWFSLSSLRRKAKKFPRMAWCIPYTNMVQISLAGYMVSGAFLGRAYFDFYYLLVALTVLLKVNFQQELRAAIESEFEEPVTAKQAEEELVPEAADNLWEGAR